MITAVQFVKKYSKYLTTGEAIYNPKKELNESKIHQNRCIKMLREVMDGEKETLRNFLLGNINLYYAFGIGGTYANAAVNKVYETVLFYIQSGWWVIGFDKGTPLFDGMPYKKLQYKQNGGEKIVAYFGGEKVIASTDENFHYAMAMFRSPDAAMREIEKIRDTYEIYAAGFCLAFEKAEMIGDGYSAVNHAELAEIMMLNV